jgi:hypothetical protein
MTYYRISYKYRNIYIPIRYITVVDDFECAIYRYNFVINCNNMIFLEKDF